MRQESIQVLIGFFALYPYSQILPKTQKKQTQKGCFFELHFINKLKTKRITLKTKVINLSI